MDTLELIRNVKQLFHFTLNNVNFNRRDPMLNFVCLWRSSLYKTSAERKCDAQGLALLTRLPTLTIIYNNIRKEGPGAITQWISTGFFPPTRYNNMPFFGLLPSLHLKQDYNQFSEWLTQELTSQPLDNWFLNNSIQFFANFWRGMWW